MRNAPQASLTLNAATEPQVKLPRSMLIFCFIGMSAISLITSFSLLAAAVYIH